MNVLVILGVISITVFFILCLCFVLLSQPPHQAAITKEMYAPELRSFYRPGRFLAAILSKKWGVNLLDGLLRISKGQKIDGIISEEQYLPGRHETNYSIRVRIFRPETVRDKLPAMLYMHAGGYMMGLPELALPFIEDIIKRRNVVVVAPAYRLSLKNPYPAGFNDCYDTLLWMKENANALGIYNDGFILAGHSAGGGLTAALALRARDTKDVKIAFQMPVYPMLDYRQFTESSKLTGTLIWDDKSNRFAWANYLKNLSADEITAYASPALTTDFSNIPPAISFVGELEPFRDETITFMKSLEAAGVPAKFKLFEGAFHGFDTVAPKTKIGQEAIKFQGEAFEEFFDRYLSKKSGKL